MVIMEAAEAVQLNLLVVEQQELEAEELEDMVMHLLRVQVVMALISLEAAEVDKEEMVAHHNLLETVGLELF
jgi:hypothetical protein